MESKYGSLTRGMLAAHRKMRTGRPANVKNGSPSAPRSIFTALRGGMQQLVDAVTLRIDPASVRLSTPASSLEKTVEGWKITAAGETELYDAVIMASPAWAAAALLTPVDAALGAELSAIPYSSSITVNLIYDEARLGRLPDGFGFLVPAVEGRAMLACTFVHRKFLGRAPRGKAVLRAFLGGMRNEALIAASDETLVATVRRELSEILGEGVVGLGIEPEYAQVSRWSRAMAQYAVGHLERKQRIAEHVAALPGLRLAGNAYDGIGIPDCIRLGRQAARELLA
jgi:oxygen-dependent protoporphyrinogen oxidase